LSFYIKTGRHRSFHPLPQYLPVKTKTARETLSLTIYSLSMGTAILINKTFLTSEYKLNSRIRHCCSGLLNAFSSGIEQNQLHIYYIAFLFFHQYTSV
ncbi:MAG: hypothetical protein J6D10_05630, partial [Clostridia bacterium]|nr:hypothetical protein [Clostridia bacterium]